jgi:uncharacterized protein (TIGR02145 family)
MKYIFPFLSQEIIRKKLRLTVIRSYIPLIILILIMGRCTRDEIEDSNSNGILFNSKKSYSSFKDNEGNTYMTILIGNQTWMAENLKSTKYNDGTDIPYQGFLNPANSEAYCWYNDDISNKNTYGGLFDLAVVNTGKICPIGWHIPTDSEWGVLIDYLGGSNIAGAKLKEAGTSHWGNDKDGATNESGFTALPGGFRFNNAAVGIGTSVWPIYSFGNQGNFWSSTFSVKILSCASNGNLFSDNTYMIGNFNSIRCLKDN